MLRKALFGLILTGLLASSGWADEEKKADKQEGEPTQVLMADANGDGTTDGLDQLIWAANNGTTTTNGAADGDFNGDGVVDGLDYLVWAAEFTDGTAPEVDPDPLPAPLDGADRLTGWNIATQGVPLPTTPGELVTTLSMLPPLQKVHWSWPWSKAMLRDAPLALQVARISGSVGLTVSYATQEQVDLAVALCRAAEVRISLQYSPWMHDYEDAHGGDPRHWGEAHAAEVELMEEKVGELVAMLGINSVLVGVFELDQENLRSDYNEFGRPDPEGGQRPDQLAAVQVKNDIAYMIVKRAFPDAEIVWHGMGHAIDTHHSPLQKHDGYAGAELYQNQGGPQLYKSMVTKFVEVAEGRGFEKFLPATSLAGFYDVSVSLPHPGYVRDAPYPVRYSWHKGRSTNHPYFASERFEHRFGPTWKIDQLYWWPAPFAASHIGYAEHFIAYVAGAHNMKASEGNWLDVLEK